MNVAQLINQATTSVLDSKVSIKAYVEWVQTKVNVIDQAIKEIANNEELSNSVVGFGDFVFSTEGLQKAIHRANSEVSSSDWPLWEDTNTDSGLLQFINAYSASIGGDGFTDVEEAYNTMFSDLNPYDPTMEYRDRYRRMAESMGIGNAWSLSLNDIESQLKVTYFDRDIRDHLVKGSINGVQHIFSANFVSSKLDELSEDANVMCSVIEAIGQQGRSLADIISFTSMRLSTRFANLSGHARGLMDKYLSIINNDDSIINKIRTILFNFTPNSVDLQKGITTGASENYVEDGLGWAIASNYFLKRGPDYKITNFLAHPETAWSNLKDVVVDIWAGISTAFNTFFPKIRSTFKKVATALTPSSILYFQNVESYEELTCDHGYYHWTKTSTQCPVLYGKLIDHPNQMVCFPALGFTLYACVLTTNTIDFYLRKHIYDFTLSKALYDYVKAAAYDGNFDKFSELLAQIDIGNLKVTVNDDNDLPYALKSEVASSWILPLCIKLYIGGTFADLYNITVQSGSMYDNTFTSYQSVAEIPTTITGSAVYGNDYVYTANDSRADTWFSQLSSYLENWFGYTEMNPNGFVPYYYTTRFNAAAYNIMALWDITNSYYMSCKLFTLAAVLAGAALVAAGIYINLRRVSFEANRKADIDAFDTKVSDDAARRSALKARILQLLCNINPLSAASWAIAKTKEIYTGIKTRLSDDTDTIMGKLNEGVEVDLSDISDDLSDIGSTVDEINNKIGSIE